MNAAVAESEQRWQSKEQELQTQVSELQAELRKEKLRVSLLHGAAATTWDSAGLLLLLLLPLDFLLLILLHVVSQLALRFRILPQ